MDAKNVIGGLLAGAAIGVAIGMLLAPASGAESRRNIVKGSKRLKDGLKGSIEDSIDSVKSRFNYGVDEMTRKGKDALAMADGKRI